VAACDGDEEGFSPYGGIFSTSPHQWAVPSSWMASLRPCQSVQTRPCLPTPASFSPLFALMSFLVSLRPDIFASPRAVPRPPPLSSERASKPSVLFPPRVFSLQHPPPLETESPTHRHPLYTQPEKAFPECCRLLVSLILIIRVEDLSE